MSDPSDIDRLIAEVERLDREATPGPWLYYKRANTKPGEWLAWALADVDDEEEHRITAEGEPADIAFIAISRTAAPLLAAEVRRLRDEVQQRIAHGNALYDAIVRRLTPHYPAGSRDLDWDVLPGTLAALARERDEAVLALAAEHGKPEGAPDDRWSVASRGPGGRPTWCRQAVVQGHAGTLYVEYDPLRMGKGWQWSFNGPTAVSEYQDTTGCRQGMIDANGAEG